MIAGRHLWKGMAVLFIMGMVNHSLKELIRGRSTLGDEWPVLLTLPVALAIGWFLDRLRDLPPKIDTAYKGQSLQCPACGLWSPPGANRCDCGRSLNQSSRTF